jgi:hypothetical protein
MAAVSVVNLVIQKGTDFEETFSLVAEDGLGLNLTNFSATAKLKKHSSSTTSYDFNTVITIADSTIKIVMSDTVTSTLPSGRCYYDLIITSSGGVVSKVIQGTALVEESVTV